MYFTSKSTPFILFIIYYRKRSSFRVIIHLLWPTITMTTILDDESYKWSNVHRYVWVCVGGVCSIDRILSWVKKAQRSWKEIIQPKSNSFILFVVLVEKNSRFFFESKMERESENHYSKLNIHTLDRFFSIDKNLLSWLNLNRIFFRFRFTYRLFRPSHETVKLRIPEKKLKKFLIDWLIDWWLLIYSVKSIIGL